MYKVTKEDNIKKVQGKELEKLDKVEGDLQDWIISNPEILCEEILLIGSGIKVTGVNEELDLLGVDAEGNLLIIELKRGRTPGDVDLQALKYTSYISNWNRDQIEKQFEQFKNGSGKKLYEDRDFANFNELLEDFCGEEYSLNEEQRIIIVAEEISKKIGSVLVWLENQGIDVSGIEIRAYKNDGNIFLDSDKIIPAPTYDRFKVGQKGGEEEKWKTEGREWHFENRCSKKTKKDIKNIIDFVEENFADELDGPDYNQKLYIAFRIGRRNVLAIKTHAKQTNLDFHFRGEDLEKCDKEEIKSKFGAKEVQNKKRYIRVKIPQEYNIPEEEFKRFLKDSIQSIKS